MTTAPVQRIHRQVLVLVGISMALVLGSLGIGMCLSRQIRSSEFEKQAVLGNCESLERDLRMHWEDAGDAFRRWMDTEVADWERRDPSEGLNAAADLLRVQILNQSANRLGGEEEAMRLLTVVGAGQRVADRLADWRTERDEVNVARSAAIASIRGRLADLRMLISRCQGKAKLQAASILVADRTAGSGGEHDVAAPMQELVLELAAIGTLSAELATIDEITAQLSLAQSTSAVDDLWKNRLRPALARCREIADDLARRLERWREAPPLLAEVQVLWNGGDDGLLADLGMRGAYALQLEILRSESDIQALTAEIDALRTNWHNTADALVAQLRTAADHYAADLRETADRMLWLNVAIGGAMALGILVLGRAMARNIRRQVSLMEELTSSMAQVNDQMTGLVGALEAAPDAIVIATSGGLLEWSNSAFERIRGALSPPLAAPEDATARGDANAAVAAAERVPSELQVPTGLVDAHADPTSDLAVRFPSGERAIFSLRWRPLGGERGHIVRAVAVLRDVTADREREDSLRRLDDEKEMILGSLDALLIGVDETGVVSSWNSVAEAVTGVTATEAVGAPIHAIAAGWSADELVQAIATVLRDSGALRLDHLRLSLDGGRSATLALSVNPILDKAHRLHGCLVLGRDVTHQFEVEQQLHQAQKLESIGQLAAGIAHEINTPSQFVSDNLSFLGDSFRSLEPLLAACGRSATEQVSADALRALAQQADLEYLTGEIPKAIDEGLNGMKRITTIVRAMKQFSHPDTGVFESCNLNQAIESTVTIARNEWKYVADVEFDLDPALPAVDCLLGEFNQVVLNMVVNSAHAIGDVVKATPGAKGRIHITTRCHGDHVRIAISDTGAGIPEKIRHRIFDPFFTTKGVGKGTGQGLAIARAVIVDRHHGTISVDSKPGAGTTFTIEIPLTQLDTEAGVAA